MLHTLFMMMLISGFIIVAFTILPCLIIFVCGALWDTAADLWTQLKEYLNEQCSAKQ